MSTDKDDLEPLDPETGVELFLEHKATDCTDSTVRNHSYRMKKFLNWCDVEGINNLNQLSGRDVQRFRLWIADDDDVNALTMENLMSGFRVFLKWAGSVEAVPENLYSKLMIPRVRRSEQSSEKILETERAEISSRTSRGTSTRRCITSCSRCSGRPVYASEPRIHST